MTQYAKNYEYGNLNNTNGAYGYRDKSRVNWQGLTFRQRPGRWSTPCTPAARTLPSISPTKMWT